MNNMILPRLILFIIKLIVSSTLLLSVLGEKYQTVHETSNLRGQAIQPILRSLNRTYDAGGHQLSTECRAFHSYEQPTVFRIN